MLWRDLGSAAGLHGRLFFQYFLRSENRLCFYAHVECVRALLECTWPISGVFLDIWCSRIAWDWGIFWENEAESWSWFSVQSRQYVCCCSFRWTLLVLIASLRAVSALGLGSVFSCEAQKIDVGLWHEVQHVISWIITYNVFNLEVLMSLCVWIDFRECSKGTHVSIRLWFWRT